VPVGLLFLPLPVLFWEERKPFLQHLGQLVLAPFSSVPFEMAMLGDVLTSMTKFLQNVM